MHRTIIASPSVLATRLSQMQQSAAACCFVDKWRSTLVPALGKFQNFAVALDRSANEAPIDVTAIAGEGKSCFVTVLHRIDVIALESIFKTK